MDAILTISPRLPFVKLTNVLQYTTLGPYLSVQFNKPMHKYVSSNTLIPY